MTVPSRETHLEPHEVAGYVGGSLAQDDRARVESHLADCEECTSEVAAVARLRPRTGVFPKRLGLAAAAAAVLVIVMGRPGERSGAGTGPLVRGDTAAVVVTAVAPADGAEVKSAPRLVWHPVADASGYRVSVTRPNGDSAWAVMVDDTAVTAPDSVLAPGAYFWYVDALLSDGRSIAGKAREFRLAP